MVRSSTGFFKVSGIKASDNKWLGFAMQDYLTTILSQDPEVNIIEKAQIKELFNAAALDMAMGAEEVVGESFYSAAKSISSLVVGTITVLGNLESSAMQINYRIVSMKDAKVIFSASQRTKLNKLFDCQEEIGKNLIHKLSDPKKYKVSQRITNNFAAYRFYSLAKGSNNLEQKLKLFKEAIALDLNFKEAIIGKAMTFYIKDRSQKTCKNIAPLLTQTLTIVKNNPQNLPANWHYLNAYCFLYAYEVNKSLAYKKKAISEFKLYLKKASSGYLRIRGPRIKRQLKKLMK